MFVCVYHIWLTSQQNDFVEIAVVTRQHGFSKHQTQQQIGHVGYNTLQFSYSFCIYIILENGKFVWGIVGIKNGVTRKQYGFGSSDAFFPSTTYNSKFQASKNVRADFCTPFSWNEKKILKFMCKRNYQNDFSLLYIFLIWTKMLKIIFNSLFKQSFSTSHSNFMKKCLFPIHSNVRISGRWSLHRQPDGRYGVFLAISISWKTKNNGSATPYCGSITISFVWTHVQYKLNGHANI